MNRNAKFLQGKSKTHQITANNDGQWTVISGASGNEYIISRVGGVFSCTCDWGFWHAAGECSHTVAVRRWLAQQDGKNLSAWASKEDAERQKKAAGGDNQGVWFTLRNSEAKS